MVSFSGLVRLPIADFEEFKGGFQGNGQQNMQGVLKLEKIREWSQRDGISVILAPGAVVTPTTTVEREILTFA